MDKKKNNYISPKGYQNLVEELEHLLKSERPEVTKLVQWAASNGDRSENADYLYGKRRFSARASTTKSLLAARDQLGLLSVLNLDLAEEATALRDAAAFDAERIASLERDVAALTAHLRDAAIQRALAVLLRSEQKD